MTLTVTHLSHHYAATDVLHDLSFAVAKGEVIAVLGASGGGKTTLLRLIAGLNRVQRGAITWDDETLANATTHCLPEARRIGLVFQDYALFPHLTVAQNIGFGLPKRERGRVAQLLHCFSLDALAEFYPHQLSGGQQQRVALLRAMAPKPRLLLMDEPFNSLDRHCRDAIRAETMAFIRAHGVTTLLVTHDPEEALEFSDKIMILEQGRIVQYDTPDMVLRAPASSTIHQLFHRPPARWQSLMAQAAE